MVMQERVFMPYRQYVYALFSADGTLIAKYWLYNMAKRAKEHHIGSYIRSMPIEESES